MTAPTDPLEELRERIRATQDATERLATEAPAAKARAEGRPPRRGDAGRTSQTADEIRALANLLETLRALVPPELQQQVTEVIRQVLMLLRALIDWWVDRLDTGDGSGKPPRGEEPAVQDIPVA